MKKISLLRLEFLFDGFGASLGTKEIREKSRMVMDKKRGNQCRFMERERSNWIRASEIQMKGEIIDSYWTYKFEYGVANTTNVLELEEIIDFLKHF